MSLKDLLALSGVPGLDAAITTLTKTYAAVENIKLYKRRCEDISGRCVVLMIALRDGTVGLEGEKAVELIDEVNIVVERINRKVTEWAAFSRLRSLTSQREIKDGIERLQHDIDSAMLMFNVQLKLELARGQVEARNIQERDRAEIRELLQTIVRSQEDMRALVRNAPSSNELDSVMETLQNELHESSSLEPEQEQSFRQGLWLLHDRTSRLPPLVDLTGQVTKIEQLTVAQGSHNDIFIGKWLDKEQVALRLPRAVAKTPEFQRRYQREIRIWRSLEKHPYVVPLYGFATIAGEVYSVSPWMDNGTSTSFLLDHPDADRLRLLSEIAEGLEYLHLHNIIHGDLRGVNVLISRDETARLSDFGLSKFLEESSQGMSSVVSVNPRWAAPELLKNAGTYSTHSDVWSFGMVALELLTGQQPFNSCPTNMVVFAQLAQGKTPEKPASFAAQKGLYSQLWDLIRRCWNKKPASRPSMSVLKTELLTMRGVIEGPKKRSFLQRPSTAGSTSSSSSLLSTLRRSSSGASIKSSSGHLRVSSLTSVPQGQELPPSPKPSIISILPPILPSPVEESSPNPLHRRFSNASSPATTNRYEVDPIDFDACSSSLPTVLGSHFPQTHSPVEQTHSPVEQTHSPVEYLSPLWDRNTSSSSVGVDQFATQSSGTIIVRTNSRGDVISGTLDGLVDKLITTSNLQQDLEYRDVLLTMCHGFASPASVFSVLSRRFQDAEQLNTMEQRVDLQYNIYRLLLYWLSNVHLPVDGALLVQMKEFCVTTISPTRSSTMNDKLKDVISAIDTRSKADTLRPPPSPGSRVKVRSDSVEPEHLAAALTLLEGKQFKAILPSHYLQHVIASDTDGRVDAAIATSNRIQLWVKKSLLHHDKQEDRKDFLIFFILVAQECRRLRNFASMASVVTALTSPSISNLTLLHKSVEKSLRDALEDMSLVFKPTSGYRAYRKLYKEVVVAVPWLPAHLHELSGIMTFSRAHVEVDSHSLINFERYVKFVECVKELRRVADVEGELMQSSDNGRALIYLKHQLRTVDKLDPHVSSEVDMMRRSDALQAEDVRYERLPTKPLKQLGFKVGP